MIIRYFSFFCFGCCFKFKSKILMIQLAAPCYDAWITPETESFAAHDLLNDVNSSRGGRTERYDEQSRLNHSTYYSLISLAAVRNLWSVSPLYKRPDYWMLRLLHPVLNLTKRWGLPFVTWCHYYIKTIPWQIPHSDVQAFVQCNLFQDKAPSWKVS